MSGPLPPLRRDLAPTDRVHALFYAFVLTVATLRVAALPEPWKPYLWYGGALGATLLLARLLRGRQGLSGIVPRAIFTIAVAPFSFLMLSFVVPYANPFHGERLLYDVDNLLFLGANPNVLLDAIAWPPLTELLTLVYSAYYGIPLVLLVVFLAQTRHDAVARGTFLVLLCLYGSYLGYFVIPATGPNLNRAGLYPAHFADPMPGVWFAERIRASLLEAEWIKHDCWPSGHTALSWTCLLVAKREGSHLAFRILLVPVVLLIFSTMYLRYHYVIDVICGYGLAWLVLRFGPRLYDRWVGTGGDAGAGAHGGSARTAEGP